MKEKTVFFCSECGYETPKWLGKCPGCDAWGTLVEQRVTKPSKSSASSFVSASPASRPKKLKEVAVTAEERFTTGIDEFDRVLGGGIVQGSLILIGGAPGIGKSTLSLQMCRTIDTDKTILYVSAEESQAQIKMRADRLGIENENMLLYAETNLDEIEATISEFNPAVVIIDSIQTVYRPSLTSASGSVSQVRDATMSLMKIAKENNITLQSAVAPRYTYTDADNIGLARDGVPSVLLELPLKYMHTSVETFDMHALTECARLLTAYCAAIDDSWRDELWN